MREAFPTENRLKELPSFPKTSTQMNAALCINVVVKIFSVPGHIRVIETPDVLRSCPLLYPAQLRLQPSELSDLHGPHMDHFELFQDYYGVKVMFLISQRRRHLVTRRI